MQPLFIFQLFIPCRGGVGFFRQCKTSCLFTQSCRTTSTQHTRQWRQSDWPASPFLTVPYPATENQNRLAEGGELRKHPSLTKIYCPNETPDTGSCRTAARLRQKYFGISRRLETCRYASGACQPVQNIHVYFPAKT